MHFDLTDDQAAFRDSLRRALAAQPVLPDRMLAGTAAAERPRYGALARQLAELGVPGILVAEAADGSGLGYVEASIAAAEFGRVALPFPGLDSILATAAVALADPAAVGPLLEGAETATCAIDGALRPDGDRLRGRVTAAYAESCRWLVAALDVDTVAVVDLTEGGVTLRPQDSLDLTQLYAAVEVDLVLPAAHRVPFRLEPALRLLGCAEMAAAARTCLDRAVEHMTTRTQFGRAIGTNQALRHMAASDAHACDSMALAVEYAAWAMDAAPAAEAAEALAAARAGIAEAARTVAEHSVQLHGGIGFTWEYGLHLHVRRIARLAAHFGGAAAEQERLARAALAACDVADPLHPAAARTAAPLAATGMPQHG